MPVNVISTIKPKNNGTFPVVEDIDILIKASGARLSEVVATMATQAQITALQAAVAGKASQADLTALSETVSGKQNALTTEQLAAVNSGITSELVSQITINTNTINSKASASDVTTSVNNLQGQIDQIVISSAAESVVAPEVAAARVDGNGTQYNTLKERIDANVSDLTANIRENTYALDTNINRRIPVVNIVDEGEVLKGVTFEHLGSAEINGKIIASGDPNSTIIIVKVKPSEKYWISQLSNAYYNICLYDADMTFLTSLYAIQPSPAWNALHTMPNNCYYLAFYSNVSDPAIVAEDNVTLYNDGYKYVLDGDVLIQQTSLGTIPSEISGIKSELGNVEDSVNSRMPIVNLVDEGELLIGVKFEHQNSSNINGNIIPSDDPNDKIIIVKVKPSTSYWINQLANYYYNVCLYDASMNFISSLWGIQPSPAWNAAHTMPNNCYYLAFKNDQSAPAVVLEDNLTAYNNGKKYVVSADVGIPDSPVNLNMFLPPDIFIAEGRTIEIYNSQVLLNANRYNIQWQCTVGIAYGRKYSITATAAMVGNDYPIIINVFDDNLNKIGTATSTVHVVANTVSSGTKIVTIGDSLSYSDKRQFPEIRLLSNDNIEFIGTKAYTTVASDDSTHAGYTDGRPGFTSGKFIDGSGSTYYDNESHNSFWDGSKFDFSYYVSNTLNNVAPSAVMIWLGTNEIKNPATYVTNVTAMINAIHAYNATLPIYIVDTVYRANQDAIGEQGAVEGYNPANGSFKYREDKYVMDFMKSAYDAFAEMSNVILVPLATLHDSEYNYGEKEEYVNPRSTKKFTLPEDSIHPRKAGQYQVADVFFSWICGTM